MTFKMADKDRIISIYNLRADTKEFIGKGDAYIPAHTGLPAYCTDIEPPAALDGQIQIFDDKAQTWSLVDNYRGQTVYSITDGAAITITEPGPLPDNTTLTAPPDGFVKWNGSEWIKDEEAEKAAAVRAATEQKSALLTEANSRTADLRTKLMLEVITDEEKETLKVWVAYIDAVNAVDTSTAPDITWPEKPE